MKTKLITLILTLLIGIFCGCNVAKTATGSALNATSGLLKRMSQPPVNTYNSQARVNRPIINQYNLVSQLNGCKLIAADGQYLGVLTTNTLSTDSIFNTIGTYGSTISSTSIFNTISQYGSSISSMSAFNSIASDPPKIVNDAGNVLGYLTTNSIKPSGFNTYVVIGLFKSGI